ncbi:MAG: hypothetical protein AB1921_05295 [Thermodesulfobacteriota bacterium]
MSRVPEIGNQAPDFTLPLAGGGSFTLSARVSEKPLLLIFYRGHW